MTEEPLPTGAEAYSATILADSVSEGGDRLTSLELRIPKFLQAQLNTHRMLSRSASSSRAVPVHRTLSEVLTDPYIPLRFGRNCPGMKSKEYLEGTEHEAAVDIWLAGRNRAVKTALELLMGADAVQQSVRGSEEVAVLADLLDAAKAEGRLEGLGVHKEFANRVLEPYAWQRVIVSATDWSNMLALRTDTAAQIDFRCSAVAIQNAMAASRPKLVRAGDWHAPYTDGIHTDIDNATISAARCARVSYKQHDGGIDQAKDEALAKRLLESGHLSPFEHVAVPGVPGKYTGNFCGWIQYRKMLPNEADFTGRD